MKLTFINNRKNIKENLNDKNINVVIRTSNKRNNVINTEIAINNNILYLSEKELKSCLCRFSKSFKQIKSSTRIILMNVTCKSKDLLIISQQVTSQHSTGWDFSNFFGGMSWKGLEGF